MLLLLYAYPLLFAFILLTTSFCLHTVSCFYQYLALQSLKENIFNIVYIYLEISHIWPT